MQNLRMVRIKIFNDGMVRYTDQMSYDQASKKKELLTEYYPESTFIIVTEIGE